jgi:flagellar biosynthetic protein FliR
VRQAQPQTWGAEIFRAGLWIALPVVVLLLFVNLALGIVARVAPQMNVFAVGFPLTVTLGLIGLLATLPLMQAPLEAVLTRLLAGFT